MSGFLSEHRNWSAMPQDILECVSDRLPLVDYMKFRSVCKNWRSSPSGRSELVNFPKYKQWLMFYELEKSKTGIPKCYIYSESHPRCCTVKLHDFEGGATIVVVEFKLGWLLVHRSHEFLFFLYNPLTFSRINLPKLNVLSGDYSCTFTYLPTTPKCTITVVHRTNESSLKVSMCRVGDKKWDTQTIFDVSSDQIGRVIRISTCTHTHHDLCIQRCRTPLRTIVIYDPTKSNPVACNFVAKRQSTVHDYSNYGNPFLNDMLEYIKEIRSKHGREWEHRARDRDISVTFWDTPLNYYKITSRASDEMAWFQNLLFWENLAFFEPKPIVLGKPCLLEQKKIRDPPFPWFNLVVSAALFLSLMW